VQHSKTFCATQHLFCSATKELSDTNKINDLTCKKVGFWVFFDEKE